MGFSHVQQIKKRVIFRSTNIIRCLRLSGAGSLKVSTKYFYQRTEHTFELIYYCSFTTKATIILAELQYRLFLIFWYLQTTYLMLPTQTDFNINKIRNVIEVHSIRILPVKHSNEPHWKNYAYVFGGLNVLKWLWVMRRNVHFSLSYKFIFKHFLVFGVIALEMSENLLLLINYPKHDFWFAVVCPFSKL